LLLRSAAIYVGPDFVGDQWQHFRLQFRLNVMNLEYLTIYICGCRMVLLLHCARKERLMAQVFIGRMSFLLPNQQVKSLKVTKSTDPNQHKITF